MARGESYSSDRSTWSFAALLSWHLTEGTRPSNKPKRWSEAEFASAIGRTPRSVRNWRLGRNPCQDIRSVSRVLFGLDDANLPEPLSAFRDELWRAHDRETGGQQRRDGRAEVAPDRRNREAVVADYEQRVLREFEKIRARIENLHDEPASRSRYRILGWLYICALAQPKLHRHGIADKPFRDPRITAVELKIKHRSLLGSRAESKDKRKTAFIDNIVSFRFILYCHCIASGIERYDKSAMCDPLIEGLRRPSTDPDGDNDLLGDIIGDLISMPGQTVVLEHCRSALRLLGALAASMSIELQDLLGEEMLEHRERSTKKKQATLENRNAITHEIEIYFLDEEKKYSQLLDELLDELTLNLLRTQSETLTPGRVAKVTMLVNGGSDLERKVLDLVQRSDKLRNIVFATFVRQL